MVSGGWTTDLRYATENNTKEGWQLMMFKDEQWKRSNGSKKLQKSRKETPWVSPHWIWQKWQIYVRSNHRSIIQTGSGDWKKKTPLFPSVLAVALTCSPCVHCLCARQLHNSLLSQMNRTQDPRLRACRLSETGLHRSIFKQLSFFCLIHLKVMPLWKHFLYIRVTYTDSIETAAIAPLKNFKSKYCGNKIYRKQLLNSTYERMESFSSTRVIGDFGEEQKKEK